MTSAGNETVQKHRIPDPADYLEKEPSAVLAARLNPFISHAGDVTFMSDEITARTQAYPNAELVLDVKTLGWVADYLPLGWNNYRDNVNFLSHI